MTDTNRTCFKTKFCFTPYFQFSDNPDYYSAQLLCELSNNNKHKSQHLGGGNLVLPSELKARRHPKCLSPRVSKDPEHDLPVIVNSEYSAVQCFISALVFLFQDGKYDK